MMSHDASPVIELRRLSHEYTGGFEALKEVDLTIRKGEIVALLGKNGSGKTTLARHLNGLLPATDGAVLLKGRNIAALDLVEVSQQVGYVFQNPDHQIFSSTVEEEVAFGPRNFGVEGEELRQRVKDALEATGLSGREKEDPFVLTKGERQRVAVASILASRPEVIILDEPTTGLDYAEQRSAMELVRRLHAAGHTIILITHAMWVAAEYAQRCVLMNDGRVVADGPTREIFARPDWLEEAGLAAPLITRFGLRFDCPALSVDELVRCVVR